MKKTPAKAKCKNCGDIVTSVHGRDWNACKCFNDGDRGFYLDDCGNRCGGEFSDIIWIIDPIKGDETASE